jgi:HK97 family phage major capsid protein
MTEDDVITRIKGMVDEAVGPQFAEVRKENEALGKQVLELKRENEVLMRETNQRKGSTEGLYIGRALRLLAGHKGDLASAIKYNQKEFDDATGELVNKALLASQQTSGGVLLQPEFANDFIGLLRNAAVIRSLNPTSIPMPSGAINYPKAASGSTAEYVGEAQGQNVSDLGFGMISLSAKKLRVSVAISNDLILYSKAVNIDQMVRDDAIAAAKVKEDSVFLRSTGTQFTPRGLRYYAPTANVLTMTATPDLAKVTADLGRMVTALIEANIPMVRPAWIMAPRTWNYLMTIRDTSGNFAFRPEMLQGTLWGMPFRYTNQVPKNLGSGSDSEVYLIDFADVVVADTTDIQVVSSSEAAFLSGGSLVSAFANDMTAVQLIARHDLGVRREESIVVLTGVTWSA